MLIKQVLNNNVVIANNDNNEEVIVEGTGIGFRAKKGDNIDETKIQRIFVLNKNKRLLELLDDITPEVIELTDDISEYANTNFDIHIRDEVFFVLADHMNFAIKRLKEGMTLDNPFLTDIKQVFKKEYQVGLYAKTKIKEMFQVDVPDEEVGFICMHLIASEYHQDKKNVSIVFNVINTSIDYICSHYLIDYDTESLSYNRLVNHIKYFAQRYVDDKESQNQDELLDLTINEMFKEEVACMDGLAKALYKVYGKEVTQSEKNYIILHLRNCKTRN